MGTDARAVLDHMKTRLERGAHAALGVAEGVSLQAARVAFLQLTKTYHPQKFARESPEIVRQANEVFLALRAAYDSITAAQRRGAQPMPSVAPGGARLTPAHGVPAVARPAGGTPPREIVRDAAPAAQARRDREPPAVRRDDGTPVRGVPVPPSDKRDATPVRGTPIPPSKPGTDPAPPRPPTLGVTIKAGAGGKAPPSASVKDAARATPDAMAAFTLPPGVDPGTEEADLEVAMHLLRRKQWGEARRTLHALAARNTKEKRYRALLSYARGREAQDANRREEARSEFARALQLDPDLTAAKAALAQVSDAEPPERPSGGLLSRLFKK